MMTRRTLVAALLAAASWLLWLGTTPNGGDDRLFVSTKSVAERLLPGLAEYAASDVSLTFAAVAREVVRVEANHEHGQRVRVGEELAGDADADAVAHAFDTLRLLTSLRAADVPHPTAGLRGTIEVTGAGMRAQVDVGPDANEPDTVYVWVRRDDKPWQAAVVDDTVATLLEQSPATWMDARAVPTNVLALTAVYVGERAIVRDGPHWVSDGMLLARAAFEARLQGVVGAQLEPLWPRHELGAPAWQTLATVRTHADPDSRSYTLRAAQHPRCGREALLVDRGAGWLGCMRVQPWHRLKEVADNPSQLLERRLMPLPAHDVQRIEAHAPHALTLERDGGEWIARIPQPDDGVHTQRVSAAVVFALTQRMAAMDVALASKNVAWTPSLGFTVVPMAGMGSAMRVLCGVHDGAPLCRRNEGPLLQLLHGSLAELTLVPEQLAQHRLLTHTSAEVQSLRIACEGSVAQSVALDLGVWQLETPTHPQPERAVDDAAVERVLDTLAAASMQTPTFSAPQPAQCTLTLTYAAGWTSARTQTLTLDRGCQLHAQHGAAHLPAPACLQLQSSLLRDDPLRMLLEDAQFVDATQAERRLHWSRVGDRLVRAHGQPDDDADGWLGHWQGLHVNGLVHRPVPPPNAWRLQVVTGTGASVDAWLDVHERAFGFADTDWAYTLGS